MGKLVNLILFIVLIWFECKLINKLIVVVVFFCVCIILNIFVSGFVSGVVVKKGLSLLLWVCLFIVIFNILVCIRLVMFIWILLLSVKLINLLDLL